MLCTVTNVYLDKHLAGDIQYICLGVQGVGAVTRVLKIIYSLTGTAMHLVLSLRQLVSLIFRSFIVLIRR